MPQPIIFDTNLIIRHIRQREPMPADVVLPMVVVGELEAFALKADWGSQKVLFMNTLFRYHPTLELSRVFTAPYARLDAYSQGKLHALPLPPGTSARNMGKNDLWIAATALCFDIELHTNDQDFDHLEAVGLRVVRG